MDGRANHNILTPLNFLRRSAAVYPDKTAIIYGETSYSYQEFNERVNCLASALRAIGLEHLDRVAILCPNIPPMLEAHFGVPLAGGVLVAINTRLSHNEIAYIINHSGARFLLVDSELADSIRPALDQIQGVDVIINIIDPAGKGEPLDGTDYESFLATADSGPVEWWVKDENELITINYGNSKGCDVLPPRSLHQRTGRDDRDGAWCRLGLSLDLTDVPLQWLVFHLGRLRLCRDTYLHAPC